MTKEELITALISFDSSLELKELRKTSKIELLEMLEEFTDTTDIFPNGRDYEAEDEESF